MTKIRAARENAGLTIIEVADLSWRDVATVKRWESGQHSPPAPVLERLARLYGVRVADLT